MHRSGTSLLARLVNLLGATIPKTQMPATSENPSGYWESRPITRFNNRLLKSAGSDWKDDMPLSQDWFTDPARAEDRAEAFRILQEEFEGAQTFVLKCPRLCRLLPFWEQVFAEAGIAPHAVIITRDPGEVANSLAARASVPEFAPAAISSAAASALLWLRYTLEAEQYSRNIPRFFVDHADILNDWKQSLKPIFEGFISGLPLAESNYGPDIDALFRPEMRRSRTEADRDVTEDPQVQELLQPLRILQKSFHEGNTELTATCDSWRQRLDHVSLAYAPARKNDTSGYEQDMWCRAMLLDLQLLFKADAMMPAGNLASPGNILFLSGKPRSIGHVFRIAHPAGILRSAGWSVEIMATGDPHAEEAIGSADMVIVFRSEWNDAFGMIRQQCLKKGIPLVYDIDDLIFEPDIIHPEDIKDKDFNYWSMNSMSFRQALSEADAAILTTKPLVRSASELCAKTFELPNTLDDSLAAYAAVAERLPKPSEADGKIRIGFMSGTATHERDFRVVAPVLAEILGHRPDALLVIVGALDVLSHAELDPFRDRIEMRPRVPLNELLDEMARIDIHISPLEMDYPLCHCKSAIRVNFAGAVGVPSVASATTPHCHAVIDGISGHLAWNKAHWLSSLYHLLDEPETRRRMGKAARIHTMAQYGPEMGGMLTHAVYGILTALKVRKN